MHMTTAGIVLREVNYKESDKILTVLTRDAGKLTISARGCQRKNSPVAAVSQLLINCTSLGMTGQGEFDDLAFVDALPEGAAVCDLIYDPGETKLLRRARNRGLPAMNGLPMLVWQGVLALEQFLGGRPLDRKKLARAAYQVLEQSKGCR